MYVYKVMWQYAISAGYQLFRFDGFSLLLASISAQAKTDSDCLSFFDTIDSYVVLHNKNTGYKKIISKYKWEDIQKWTLHEEV